MHSILSGFGLFHSNLLLLSILTFNSLKCHCLVLWKLFDGGVSIMQVIRSIDEWRAIISDCRASGLSDREWCSEHDIPLSTFYNKIKKLREQACPIPDHTGNKAVQKQEIVPLLVEDDTTQGTMETPGTSDYNSDGIHIEYNGFLVSIPFSAPDRCVSSVIAALGSLC